MEINQRDNPHPDGFRQNCVQKKRVNAGHLPHRIDVPITLIPPNFIDRTDGVFSQSSFTAQRNLYVVHRHEQDRPNQSAAIRQKRETTLLAVLELADFRTRKLQMPQRTPQHSRAQSRNTLSAGLCNYRLRSHL